MWVVAFSFAPGVRRRRLGSRRSCVRSATCLGASQHGRRQSASSASFRCVAGSRPLFGRRWPSLCVASRRPLLPAFVCVGSLKVSRRVVHHRFRRSSSASQVVLGAGSSPRFSCRCSSFRSAASRSPRQSSSSSSVHVVVEARSERTRHHVSSLRMFRVVLRLAMKPCCCSGAHRSSRQASGRLTTAITVFVAVSSKAKGRVSCAGLSRRPEAASSPARSCFGRNTATASQKRSGKRADVAAAHSVLRSVFAASRPPARHAE